MKLYEYEGKKLFAKYNIKTPNGWLLRNVPQDITYPVMVKTQVLTGGRGKAGGIQKANNKKELDHITNELQSLIINGESLADIYVEETVDFQNEYYFSIIIDRNMKSPVLIISDQGGVNIEDVPKDKILFIPINPLLGIQPYMIRKIELFLHSGSSFVSELIQNIWEMFISEQAELIEINPLFILKDGSYTAGDSKVILDNSVNRTSNPELIKRNTTNYEAKCAQLNTVGVELDGDIAIITSGAGLGMATFDMISSTDLSVRTLVDLGGHAIHDEAIARKLICEIKSLKPRAFLFNFYFQVASCLVLARAIEKELGNTNIPVVVRLKGQDEGKATSLLAKYKNIHTTQNINIACTLTQHVVREVI